MGNGVFLPIPVALARLFGRSRRRSCASGDPMKLKIRNSKTKRAKKQGYRTRQKSAGGRKVNKRQRARHGSF